MASETIDIPPFRWAHSGGTFEIISAALSISAGRTYYLCGPSGSGKTTFLDLLVRASVAEGPASSPIPGLSWLGRVSYLMHASALAPWLTLRQNLKLESRLRAQPYDDSMLVQLLEELELSTLELDSTFPRKLSHGMRQRFELISALCFRPNLLLIDEGLSGIHQPLRDKAIRLICSQCTMHGMCVLFTSHNLTDALRMADSVLTVNDGQICEPVELIPQRGDRIHMPAEQLLSLQDLQRLMLHVR